MKKTNFALVLAIFALMASIAMWGQTTLSTPASVTDINQSADSTGGHMTRGCSECHTPHSLGVNVQASAKGITKWQGACTAGPCATGVTAQGSAVGLPVSGGVYLWGQALPPLTYSSWDTTGSVSFSAAAVSGAGVLSHPEVHSLMCLSCHDGATTGSSYDMGYTSAGGITGSGTSQSFNNPALVGVAWSQYNGGAGPNGWSNSSSLMNSHPIHAHYTTSGQALPGLWQVTVNASAYTVYFNDTSFNYWSAMSAVGHPGRLYTDGVDAYVECTTCHEPHRFSQYAYPANGSWNSSDLGTGNTAKNWQLGPANSTVYYIRGPYSDATSKTDGSLKGNITANGELNAQFCRSCHYEKSIEYFNNGGAPK
jgi:hypothetical protein